MKYRLYILFIFIVFITIIFIKYPNTKNSIQNTTLQPVPSRQNETKTYETKIDSKGSVGVEVTPITLVPGSEMKFQLKLNTHSVALDKDLKDISILTDDKGKEYRPISWSGGAGGHHLTGVLSFPKIAKTVRSVKLIILGIDSIDREFSWNL